MLSFGCRNVLVLCNEDGSVGQSNYNMAAASMGLLKYSDITRNNWAESAAHSL
jgi:hypothetical protein